MNLFYAIDASSSVSSILVEPSNIASKFILFNTNNSINTLQSSYFNRGYGIILFRHLRICKPNLVLVCCAFNGLFLYIFQTLPLINCRIKECSQHHIIFIQYLNSKQLSLLLSILPPKYPHIIQLYYSTPESMLSHIIQQCDWVVFLFINM